MKHFGGADAVDQLNAAGLFPELARGVGQCLAGADTQAQTRRLSAFLGLIRHEGGHLTVKRGCGVANGGAGVENELRHGRRRVGNIREINRGPGPHRKNQQAAQTEGESQRWRAHHNITRTRLQHMARPGFAGRQHVPMGVYRRLGLTGGA